MIRAGKEVIVKDDPSEQATIAMYDQIPHVFAGHFAGFRSCIPDIKRAHQIAGLPVGESSVVEIGCGDGRDAENAFVPNSAQYIGYDPSKGLLEIARSRFPGAPKDMFREGYAQSTDYPEATDIMMAVNSILHVPKSDLKTMFGKIASGLRDGGVFYAITKVADRDTVEVYHDNFEGITGERTFIYHSPTTLEKYAGKAGLKLAFEQRDVVENKDWDWYSVAVQK